MAIIAFIASSVLGLALAVTAGVTLGLGLVAGFAIYLGVSITLPLLILGVALSGDDADTPTFSGAPALAA